jgi:hypothetical protein
MTDECDPPPGLAQQAFSVYCDQVVRDAVEKNDILRAENATMEAARKMLTQMMIYKNLDDDLSTVSNKRCEKVMEINLQTGVVVASNVRQQYQSNSATHVVCNVEEHAIEFPYEDAPRLYCEIANVRLKDGRGTGRAFPRLIARDESDEPVCELEFYPSPEVRITGTLKNFSGTMQEVKQMIESGKFLDYYMTMGCLNPDTGGRFPKTIGNSLDGAICSLKKVEIAKTIVRSIHIKTDDDAVTMVNDRLLVDEESDQELHVLANATNTKHEGLCKAIMDRRVLQARNSLLKFSREIFQTLTARYPGTSLPFKLDHGSVGRMRCHSAAARTTTSQEAAWVVTAEDSRRESIIWLSDLSMLRLTLAKVTWWTDIVGRPVVTPDGFILNHSNNIEAVFRFDESLNDVDVYSLPEGLYAYIYHALSLVPQQGGHWQRQHRPHQRQGPQFTVRLVAFHIRLSAIQSHLDALGIEVNAAGEY